MGKKEEDTICGSNARCATSNVQSRDRTLDVSHRTYNLGIERSMCHIERTISGSNARCATSNVQSRDRRLNVSHRTQNLGIEGSMQHIVHLICGKNILPF